MGFPLFFFLIIKSNNIFFLQIVLRNGGERRALSESFQPFCAEPHKFYIYHQYTNIVYLLGVA
jgi:hypothetical protein